MKRKIKIGQQTQHIELKLRGKFIGVEEWGLLRDFVAVFEI